jgi:hypothetical protein
MLNKQGNLRSWYISMFRYELVPVKTSLVNQFYIIGPVKELSRVRGKDILELSFSKNGANCVASCFKLAAIRCPSISHNHNRSGDQRG